MRDRETRALALSVIHPRRTLLCSRMMPTLPAGFSPAAGGPHASCDEAGELFQRCIWHAHAGQEPVVVKAFARRAHAAPGDRWPRHFLHQLRIECNALRDIERAAGADSLIARRVPRCLSLCLDESCDDFRALPHIALTRLEGPTLDAFSRELLETASLVERRNALFDFAHEALITLDHLWSLGFVHRDLSGANLIVLRHPSRSTPVAAALVDFDAALHVSACPTIEQPSSELQGASDRCMPKHLLPPPRRLVFIGS